MFAFHLGSLLDTFQHPILNPTTQAAGGVIQTRHRDPAVVLLGSKLVFGVLEFFAASHHPSDLVNGVVEHVAVGLQDVSHAGFKLSINVRSAYSAAFPRSSQRLPLPEGKARLP